MSVLYSGLETSGISAHTRAAMEALWDVGPLGAGAPFSTRSSLTNYSTSGSYDIWGTYF